LISAAVLNSAYRNARNADVRERILLITRVRLDKNEASSVAEIFTLSRDLVMSFSNVHSIFHTLGIPVSSGLVLGFFAGFVRTH
jgi:hypothetical protein